MEHRGEGCLAASLELRCKAVPSLPTTADFYGQAARHADMAHQGKYRCSPSTSEQVRAGNDLMLKCGCAPDHFFPLPQPPLDQLDDLP